MMKKITLTIIALMALISTNAQEILFEDDFETYDDFIIADVGDFTLLDVDGFSTYGFNGIEFDNSGAAFAYIVFNATATTPPLDPTESSDWTAHSGDKAMAAFASVVDDAGNGNDDWLITPSISLSPDGDNTLTFWAKSTSADFGNELFNVGVSTTDTDPASFTFIETDIAPDTPLEWQKYTFNLDSYVGEDVYIAINHVAIDQFGFMVDDISVSLGELGVKDQSIENFNYYVSKGTLNISASTSFESVAVYNMLGQQMINKKLAETNENIDISGLSSGLYIVQVQIDGQAKSFKIVR